MKRLAILAVLMALVLSLSACGNDTKTNFSSSVNAICEMATLECYYHNIAAFEDSGTNLLITTVGKKKVWIEYEGIVKIGIDASKMSISEPDSAGVVTVTIPNAKVLSIDINDDSIKEECVSDGVWARITTENKTKALAEAQKNMREAAENDESILNMGYNRAKRIIEKYIVNMGTLLGKTYKVQFKDYEET